MKQTHSLPPIPLPKSLEANVLVWLNSTSKKLVEWMGLACKSETWEEIDEDCPYRLEREKKRFD